MIMYKLLPPDMFGKQLWVLRLSDLAHVRLNGDSSEIIEARRSILAGETELQDADGNTMTPEQAKAYIEELP